LAANEQKVTDSNYCKCQLALMKWKSISVPFTRSYHGKSVDLNRGLSSIVASPKAAGRNWEFGFDVQIATMGSARHIADT